MKRLITFICLIVVIALGYYLITNGFENDAFNIASYEQIETKSEALTKKLASYDKKNQEEYENALTSLNSTIKMYKNSKTKYEGIYEELADLLGSDSDSDDEDPVEEIIYSDKEKYNVDFLFVSLGNYGEKEGVDVYYQLTTSSTTDPNSTTLGYFLADLKFVVTGQYIDVSNFISDLENDDKLSWEIRDFQMAEGNANGHTGVAAKFTIKDVPIDSESYIASSVPAVDTTTKDPNALQPDGTTNPADPNATSTDGSTTGTTTNTGTTDGTTSTTNPSSTSTTSDNTTNTITSTTTTTSTGTISNNTVSN